MLAIDSPPRLFAAKKLELEQGTLVELLKDKVVLISNLNLNPSMDEVARLEDWSVKYNIAESRFDLCLLVAHLSLFCLIII